jgi:hypothetical protein
MASPYEQIDDDPPVTDGVSGAAHPSADAGEPRCRRLHIGDPEGLDEGRHHETRRRPEKRGESTALAVIVERQAAVPGHPVDIERRGVPTTSSRASETWSRRRLNALTTATPFLRSKSFPTKRNLGVDQSRRGVSDISTLRPHATARTLPADSP